MFCRPVSGLHDADVLKAAYGGPTFHAGAQTGAATVMIAERAAALIQGKIADMTTGGTTHVRRPQLVEA